MTVPVATIDPVDPKAALAALFARGGTLDPSFHWQDVWQDEHADKFTVARSAGFDVLGDIYAGVKKLIAEGQTVQQAVKDLTPILQQAGWWGRQLTTDPKTGKQVVSQLGSTRRLETIFNTNWRVSYASGHWTNFEQTKAIRPFLRYVCVLDSRTRPTHRAHHNLCLPVDDPYWDIWAPPCGWNCRCTLQSLSQRDVDKMPELFFTPPQIPMRTWTNKRTGVVSQLPEGIDPGWGYNPGKAGSRAASAYADKLGTIAPEIAAAAVKAPGWPAQQLADEFSAWAKALGNRQDGVAPVDKSSFTIGAIDQTTLDALKDLGVAPERGDILVDQKAMTHMLRDAKTAVGKAVPLDLLMKMPESIANPKAVLYDLQDPALLYVFDLPGDVRLGKYVVRIDYSARVKLLDGTREQQTVNSVRTAGIVNAGDLSQPAHYHILSGEL